MSSQGRKKTTVTVPSYEGETKLPHTEFSYTYEVPDELLPTENSVKDADEGTNLETGLKLKPFHKLESKEKVQSVVRPVREFVLNNNYTYEATVHEVIETKTEENINHGDTQGELSTGQEPLTFDVADDQIFNQSLVNFILARPQKIPTPPPGQLVSETACRIIFQSVSWATHIPVFKTIVYSTQVALLRSSWPSLFIIGLAQCKDQINIGNLLDIITSNLQNYVSRKTVSLSRLRHLTNTLSKLKDITSKVDEMYLDDVEFAFLRLCSVFRIDQPSPEIRLKTENISEKVFLSFQTSMLDRQERFSKFIIQLSSLKSFQSDMLEELFFSDLIGSVPIDSVIPYILSMLQTNNNAH